MIKTVTFLTFLLFTFHFSFAQKLKKRTEVSGNFKEVYFIDKKTKIRQGKSFVINTESKDTLSVGEYKNGRRVGLWSFYDKKSGEPFMVYDYTKDQLLNLNKKFVADSFLVRIDNDFKNVKVDRPLLYTGYYDELKYTLAQKMKVPPHIQMNGRTGLCILSFRVNKSGDIVGANVVNKFSPEIEQQLNTIVMQMPGKFLPAIINDEAFESMFYVRVNIGMPMEAFVESQNIPYIKHLDIQFHSKTVKRTTRMYRIETVSGEELERLRSRQF